MGESLLLSWAVLSSALVVALSYFLHRKTMIVNKLEDDCKNLKSDFETQVHAKENELNALRIDLGAKNKHLELLQQNLDEQQQRFEKERKESDERWQQKLKDLDQAFKNVSQSVLKEQMPEFLQRTEERFNTYNEMNKSTLNEKKQEFEKLISPFKEMLEQYRQQILVSEEKHGKQINEISNLMKNLTDQNRELSNETQQFRKVLHNAASRGRWGEETLKRVVELTGMSQHCDFDTQDTSGSDNGRPDLVVRLPEGRCIIVDSKVPELDIVQDIETIYNEQERKACLTQYIEKVRKMIKDLSSRKYPDSYTGSLDYVVMFLPAESLFSLALEADRNLIEEAAKQKIILTSPASLIALLRAVSVSWMYYQHTSETKEIVKVANDLYQAFVIATEHLGKLGKNLRMTSEHYNDFVGSFERNLTSKANRLKGLLNHTKESASLDVIDCSIRTLSDASGK